MRHQDMEQTTHRRVFVAQTDPASDGTHLISGRLRGELHSRGPRERHDVAA